MRTAASERRIGSSRGRGAEDGERSPEIAAPSAPPRVKPRPALFRALGSDDPPAAVELAGEVFRLEEILKHDSWAASGVYVSETRRALCKFNRRQPVLGLPMGWLGRRLAARESGFMRRLSGIEGIPVSLGPVACDGRILRNAVSRQWVAGHALAEGEAVDDRFFPTFRRLLAAVHERGVAHVDLHKRENILVDRQGRPHLIDFQISFALPSGRVAGLLLGGLLRLLQRCDEYHLLKHELKHRPEDCGVRAADLARLRPLWIRAHRSVAVPFRRVRRRLLVTLGIRDAGGQAASEVFAEVAHRPGVAAAIGSRAAA